MSRQPRLPLVSPPRPPWPASARHLWPVLLGLAASACLPPQAGTNTGSAAGSATVVDDTPRPAWVHQEPFAVTTASVAWSYATAHAPLPGGSECADASSVLTTATNRARAVLIRALSGEAAGTLAGLEAVSAWLDRPAGVVHVLVAAPTPSGAAALRPGDRAWTTGERASGVVARITTAERARFEAAGVCKDPHRRADFPCCGPVGEMCHDPARFDTQTPPRCACGELGRPCLQDFACEGGRCVCRGPACPCDILRCREGQTCGDGRCY